MDYIIRKLEKDDYEKYILLINDFSETKFSNEDFIKILDKININSDIWIIEKNNEFIATGTILYEYKFIRNISKVSHIEDVCVSKKYRGKNYGTILMNYLIEESKKNNCYKVILDCVDKLEFFYEKSKFKKNGIQMAIYF
jgi:glucosamine-phosphate N-acetyltransferase